jgi:phosphoadenosine phosphosulfate reductase
MPLEQLELETGFNKTEVAIALLKAWEPPEGYYLAFSGGKDSVVVYDITVRSGVKFDAYYCVSPIDPPQVHKFIKEYYPDVYWEYHARGFWKLVVDKGLPLRNSRWCCQYIKEAGGKDRFVILGNRSAEGNIRKKQCYVDRKKGKQKAKMFIRPILKFDDYDVWQYIRENNLPYCSLYDEGAIRKGFGEGIFKRLGCVLCPFAGDIKREEEYSPKIVKCWKRACDKIIEKRLKSDKEYRYNFTSGEELYQWWIGRK